MKYFSIVIFQRMATFVNSGYENPSSRHFGLMDTPGDVVVIDFRQVEDDSSRKSPFEVKT